MQRDIEVKLLRALVAVVDEGGFARAAQALHVTQPTISQQIQRLESVVETPLFHRTRRPLRLSPVGREVVAHARRVLLLNTEVLSTVSALRTQERLNMGCSVHFADGLSTMLAQLSLDRPQLCCAVTTGMSEELAGKIAAEELDAAILLGAETSRGEMLGRVRLSWFGQAPALPGGEFPVALVGGGSALSRRVVETLAEHRVRWRAAPWCADPLAVRAAVGAGLAYTVLPAGAHHGDPSLRPVPAGLLGPEPEPLPVHLAFSPSAGDSLVDAARAAARAMLKDLPLSLP
ncbi:LysR family transcriptional regulator [Kitasatospora sp. MMS16-BH015]|uniref:LysR family transcriptional regulator n=1 Tax=Kitasatospora sp. MMS16-BH015 TaxID=2018025 RepID=UPI00131A55B1|nr:LysR family transcriptional regulator [Kitasatospora sp. MMS16-BH015]